MDAANQKRLPYGVGIVLVLAALACSSPAAFTGDDLSTATAQAAEFDANTAQPTETQEPTPEPTPTEPPSDPATVCPEPTADTLLYVDELNGFCLLYPASFTAKTYTDKGYLNAVFERDVSDDDPFEPTLTVNVIAQPGVAGGVTPADFVDQIIGDNTVPPEAVTLKNMTISGGLPAVVLRDYPAMIPFHSIYVTAHDTLYEIKAMPDADRSNDPVPDVDLVWTTVIESLTFFPPTFSEEVLTAETACPPATADTYLFVSKRNGFCALIPNSFESGLDYGSAWFIGGPELTGVPMGAATRVRATIWLQGESDEAVEQIVAQYTEFLDPDSLTLTYTTVSGFPAVFLDYPQGPFPSRQAMIRPDGYLYVMSVEPVDPVNFPEAVEPAELIWSALVDTLIFFEPWQ